jgi:hypothetical protein
MTTNFLQNIIDNFEDIEHTPPNYYDVVCSNSVNYPNVKFTISEDLNSKENLAKHTKKKNNNPTQNPILSMINKIKTSAPNNTNQIVDDEINLITRVKTDNNKENEKNNEQQMKFVKEKLENSKVNLEIIWEDYEKLNHQLKYLMNSFEYIKTNESLNEYNRKLKLLEMIQKFDKEFRIHVYYDINFLVGGIF